VTDQHRRARVGVSMLFLTNAVVYASVVPRFPEFKAALGLSNAGLGLAIAASPLGALVAGAVSTPVIARLGSARAGVLASVLMAANLVSIATAQSGWWLAAGLFLAGFCDFVGDIANNLHGLRVQRRYGRSILNGFHGLWSVGAVGGGVLGSAAAGAGLPVLVQLAVTAVVFVGASLAASRLLLSGSDQADRDPGHAAGPPGGRLIPKAAARGLLAMGAVAALAGVVEDSGASWGAVYLSGSLGAGPGLAGVAFIVMAISMSVSRLTGDWFVNRFGERAVARVGALVAALAMAAALAVPSTVGTMVGFGLAGLGTATMIPAAMHAADQLEGLRPGAALTVVTLITRVGFLVSPPLIGVIADAAGLRVGLVVVPVAALVALVCSRVLTSTRRASRAAEAPLRP
jgi:fucose permease